MWYNSDAEETMKPEELKTLLHSLLSNWEDEVVEFKRGGKGFSTGEIGVALVDFIQKEAVR